MVYHTFLTLIIPAIICFSVTVVSTKFIMDYLYESGIVIEDKNKEKPVKLPGSGGIAVAFGIIVGILVYAFGGSFISLSPAISISDLLAVALSIVLIALVGFLDDINIKSQKIMTTDLMDTKKGLKQWQKPLLTIIGALPLIAINAGISTVTIPLIGQVGLGILYPLLVLPLAIVFVSNAFNLLGGFDGLQPGMALVASTGFLIYSLLFGNSIGTFLSAILFASLLAFLPFNAYKAKIIPGDSFTYAIGATFVAIMVTGSAESFGVIIFIPWIIEFLLHLRRSFNVTDVGIRQKDGTFKAPYGKKIYSLTHWVMNRGRLTEPEISAYLCLIEVVFVALALLLKLYVLL
jgi:UDP-N-acetylglucosamine--dolichyl-phosphate N-acetylglucosaminephosphotransferase